MVNWLGMFSLSFFSNVPGGGTIGFSSGFDYFVSSSLKEVVIRKRQSDNTGFTIKESDFVTIIFQSEIT